MNKEETIEKIRSIIYECNGFWVNDVSNTVPIPFMPINVGVCSQIEWIDSICVSVMVYHNDDRIDEFDVLLEDLSDDLISEVLLIAEQYDAEMKKTMDRCL